jgi:hypothetical protein
MWGSSVGVPCGCPLWGFPFWGSPFFCSSIWVFSVDVPLGFPSGDPLFWVASGVSSVGLSLCGPLFGAPVWVSLWGVSWIP